MDLKNRKTVIFYALIVWICLFYSFKSFYYVQDYHKDYMPVFDSVMNESKQIYRYAKFDSSYGVIDRYNQGVYEFKSNPFGAGFSTLVTVLFPKALANDFDVLVRGFLALLSIALSLYSFLKDRITRLDFLLFFALIFNVPMLNSYRYGLVTNIAEISSALFMLSGYLLLISMLRSPSRIKLFSALLFFSCSVASRYNFVIYIVLILIPLFPLLFNWIRKWKKPEFKSYGIPTLIWLGVMCIYMLPHLDFFIEYNFPEIPYKITTVDDALGFIVPSLTSHIGVFGGISVLVGMIIISFNATKQLDLKNYALLLIPGLSMFTLIFVVLHGANTPHVYAAVYSILIASVSLVPLPFVRKLSNPYSKIIVRVTGVALLIGLNFSFHYSPKLSSTEIAKNEGPLKVTDLICNYPELNQDTKYLCLFDEAIEVPISVAVFKRTGIYPYQKPFYGYLRESAYLNCFNSNDPKVIADQYNNYINQMDFDLVFISSNQKIGESIIPNQVHELVNIQVLSSNKYELIDSISSTFHGDILVYKKQFN